MSECSQCRLALSGDPCWRCLERWLRSLRAFTTSSKVTSWFSSQSLSDTRNPLQLFRNQMFSTFFNFEFKDFIVFQLSFVNPFVF